MYPWIQPIVMLLGVWLIFSPMTLGYRSPAMTWSDIISGAVAIAIALFALISPRHAWVSYGNTFVGLWLLFAPLIFWASDAAAYETDTLIGAFLILFSFIIPMSMEMPGPEVPPGWSYNPSTWVQRAPIIALGLFGFFLARYMAGYQLGYLSSVWDPFFGEGTNIILKSEVSKAWPISDAGLGAVVYLIEALSGAMGDARRWRTMPWMVAIFGLAVIPLGVVSVALVIMQPLVIGQWCTLCLVAAGAMLVMIALSLDEVIAMIQFLAKSHRAGKPWWRVFWTGGTLPDAQEKAGPDRLPSWEPSAMAWGVTAGWNLIVSTAVGIWLLFAPALFGIDTRSSSADSDRLVGALVITIAVIAWAEVGRTARYLNLLLGAWLVVGTWFLSGGSPAIHWSDTLSGLLLILLSFPLGRIRDAYGSFGQYVTWMPGRKIEKPAERQRKAA
ncbi:dTDP-glucose 4,6-dehydratase [Nitrospiraceae bacterium HYJII51-Mn-bac16s-1-B09]|uniref:dTDP-glucose 4,6-dehydratase n=2 Tax=Candidatus Manganitrophus noduliformans TaxID=2606439 RepID=A0A7X6DUJ3_9BACT|nr:dTDP-glucose 4,6-dehydratase [Candidatus Manganitrophus noduliformans]